MCDHCGCRDQPPIGELMDEHDRIMDLAWRVVEYPAALSDDGTSIRTELRTLLEMHATKEEQALYPLLIESGDMDVDDRVVFEREHRELLELVDGDNFDADGSNVLAAHIEAEENDLFPNTMFGFDDAAWERMDRVSHDLFHRFGVQHVHTGPSGHEREWDDLNEPGTT